MDQLQGVRVLIDRLGLPPRTKILVQSMEEQRGPLNDVGETPGAQEVRRILGAVDGPNLLGCIVATMLNEIEPEPEAVAADEKAEDTRPLYERWLAALEKFPDPIILLLDGPHYITFDDQAERLAAELDAHLTSLERHSALALALADQVSWLTTLADKGLDVLLVEESADDESGYITLDVSNIEHLEPAEETTKIEA